MERTMNVDTISSPGGTMQQPMKAAEMVDAGRKNKEKVSEQPQAADDDP